AALFHIGLIDAAGAARALDAALEGCQALGKVRDRGRQLVVAADRGMHLDAQVGQPGDRLDRRAERLRRDVLELQRTDCIRDGLPQLLVDGTELGQQLLPYLRAGRLRALDGVADAL